MKSNLCVVVDWSLCSEVQSSPEILSGALVFRSTRVPISALFENLATEARVDDFLIFFPGVKRSQVDAVLAHIAESLMVRRVR